MMLAVTCIIDSSGIDVCPSLPYKIKHLKLSDMLKI